MKALVTGGAGFIGSHVVDRLIQAGHQVLVVDNLSTGSRQNLHPECTFSHGCITSEKTREIVTQFGPEVVFHLAAQIDVRVSVETPSLDASINVVGTVNIVEAARCGGALEKVVFASTGGAIYGDTDQYPTPETMPALPLSAYGTAKLCAEQYLAWFQRLHHIPYSAMRFGNVYGPRQNPHGEAGVIAIFAGRLKDGQPCTIFGDGSQSRDYVYVGDVANAFVAAGEQRAVTGIFNIGTSVETDVNTIYAKLAALSSTTAPPVYADARPGECARSLLDNRKAKEAFSWEPTTDLDAGLHAVWEHLHQTDPHMR
jgi:UDP-glucose 4-epimerase